MSKSKSITDLVTELQKENESLKNLSRVANQYTKMEFGYTVHELHLIIEQWSAYQRREQNARQKQQQMQSTQ